MFVFLTHQYNALATKTVQPLKLVYKMFVNTRVIYTILVQSTQFV